MEKLRLKTYTNVHTNTKEVLPIAVMDQYGRIFEAKTIGKKTTHQPTGKCGSANH